MNPVERPSTTEHFIAQYSNRFAILNKLNIHWLARRRHIGKTLIDLRRENINYQEKTYLNDFDIFTMYYSNLLNNDGTVLLLQYEYNIFAN